jgi:hypothetical protein
MKKLFSLFAVVLMAGSLFAENKTIYLKVSEDWAKDNARFAVFAFDKQESPTVTDWIDMAKVEGETDVYQAAIDPAKHKWVLFGRMNPEKTENNFDEGTRWNQTKDLMLLEDKDMFSIKNQITEGDDKNKYDGEWGVYKKEDPKDPVMQIAGKWTEKEGKWELKDMTLSEDKKTATYEVELEALDYEFKLIKDEKWITKANEGKPYELKRDWVGVANVKDEATENLMLKADAKGKYVFTFTFANDSLGITFPEKGSDPQPGDAKFYITGDSALIVDAGQDAAKKWAPDAIKSEKDTLVLNLKAAQEYKLKLTLKGAWTPDSDIKGYNDLSEKAKGLSTDKDNNIIFKLAEAGEVKVIYFVKDEVVTFKLMGKFDESGAVEIANGYYLIGQKGWDITVLDASLLFKAVEGAEKEEYMLEVTLKEGEEVKVVKVEENAIKQWYPEGDNYKVDAAHAGDVKIYFRPEKNEAEDWKAFGGYMYIEVKGEEAIDMINAENTTVKFFENGQLIILKNGVKYNTTGAIVR